MQALVPSQAILFLFLSIKAMYDPLFTNEKITYSDRYIYLNSGSCDHKQFHALRSLNLLRWKEIS